MTMKPISGLSCGAMDLNSEYLNCAKCNKEINASRSWKMNIRGKNFTMRNIK
jgi:hypothetical protein